MTWTRVNKWVWKVSDEEVAPLGYSYVQEFFDDGKYAINMVQARQKADYLFIFHAVRSAIVAARTDTINSNKQIDIKRR